MSYKIGAKKYKEEWRKKNPWHTSVWGSKQRCNNKNNPKYKYYGEKGIKFLITFQEVKMLWERDNAKEMGKPSLDRINSEGNYEVNNCRFIELAVNSSRHNKELTHCKRGHAYDRKNTILRKNGWRGCRECDKITLKIRSSK